MFICTIMGMLSNAAIETGSSITLKGTSEYETLIDNMLSTGSGNVSKQIITE